MATHSTIGVRSKVLEILRENPSIPYSIVGDKVGVTRERVRQIAQVNGYPPRTGVLRLKACPVCDKTFNTRNLCCSRACSYKVRRRRVVVNCCQCGKPTERTLGNMRSKSGYYFCSRVCFGIWNSKHLPIANEAKNPKKIDFTYEIGSREEFPLKCRESSAAETEIYNALLRLSENELIKVRNSNKNNLRKLEIAIKRKAKRQGISVNSAIQEIQDDIILFLMRVT